MKRLSIFFHFNSHGSINRYVDSYLRSLASVSERVVVVNNGNCNFADVSRVSKLVDIFLVRKNVGFDSWAYKYAIEHIGWQVIREFDELVLCNFTAYLLDNTIESLFQQMSARECDFWGVAKHPEFNHFFLPDRALGYIHEHIMSYFMVFKKPVIEATCFKDYWDNLPQINTYEEAVGLHETVLTKYLEDRSFKSDSFIDLELTKNSSSNASVYQADSFLIKYQCPLIKRKAFFHDYHDMHSQSNVSQGINLLQHLKSRHASDYSLILDDLLKEISIYKLAETLHLYLSPPHESAIPSLSNNDRSTLIIDNASILIYYNDIRVAEVFSELIKHFPQGIRMLVCCADEATYDFCANAKSSDSSFLHNERCDIKVDKYRGEYGWAGGICSLLEEDPSLSLSYNCILGLGEYFLDSRSLTLACETAYQDIIHSLLYSYQYINSIINEFESDSFLGAAIIPPMAFSQYDPRGYHLDPKSISAIDNICKMYGLISPIDKFVADNNFARVSACFWVRPNALTANLLKSVASTLASLDPPGIDRSMAALLPVLLQSQGKIIKYILNPLQTPAYVDNLLCKYRQQITSHAPLSGESRPSSTSSNVAEGRPSQVNPLGYRYVYLFKRVKSALLSLVGQR